MVPGSVGVSDTGAKSYVSRLAGAPTLPLALAIAGFCAGAFPCAALADEVEPGIRDEVALADADGSGMPD